MDENQKLSEKIKIESDLQQTISNIDDFLQNVRSVFSGHSDSEDEMNRKVRFFDSLSIYFISSSNQLTAVYVV